jgi:hypothetical protein
MDKQEIMLIVKENQLSKINSSSIKFEFIFDCEQEQKDLTTLIEIANEMFQNRNKDEVDRDLKANVRKCDYINWIIQIFIMKQKEIEAKRAANDFLSLADYKCEITDVEIYDWWRKKNEYYNARYEDIKTIILNTI